MRAGQFERAARIGVRITGAANHEERLCPGMLRLHVALRVTGVVTRDHVILIGERRVVAGCAKEHRTQLAVGAFNAQHRHTAVSLTAGVDPEDHAARRELAAIHNEVDHAHAVGEPRRFQML